MEGAEADNKPILKDAESVENDQPLSKETGPMKSKGQSKCGCDGPTTAKSRSSREEKLKKKDDKSVEHVLKALNSLNTTEEKLAAMCKKYADIFDENRKVQLALKQSEKRNGVLQREKEQLQADQSKSILTRSRLENLCRELQRQNKAIKDESLSKIREEEEKRKEVSAKFQSTLSEINNLMQQNSDKNSKLRDDNLDMNARLKSVCEQYELREQEVDRIAKQMQLESQLAEAKLAKAKMEMAAERELFVREKQQLLVEITQYQARCQEFQTNEINLRKQISLYNEKYDEFQKALAKSNEVFGGFKVEMDKMSKKIVKLEKETITWKQRWENSHQALLSMADDKQRCDQELGLVNRKLGALQGLCRTLQTERTAMLARLKEAGIKSDDPLMANGDATAEIDPSKDQESQAVVNSCDKKQTPDQASTKCLKNSAKKCIKDKTPVSEDAVHVNGQSGDGELKSEVNGSTGVSDVKGLAPKNGGISSESEVKSNEVVCSKPQDSSVGKGGVCLKKDPVDKIDVDHNPGSEQITADSQEVKKEGSPVDSKQTVCDLKKVPADSKQPKSKACKRNSRLTSPPKEVADAKESTVTCQKSPPPKVACAKESTVTCQKSPPRVQSPPKVACTKESTVTCQKSPPRVQSPPKVACAKESTVTCQKSPPRVQSPPKCAKESTPPKVACAKESTPTSPLKGEAAKESTPSSPTAAKDSIATSSEATKAGASSQKAANCDAKKAKDSKKKKK